MKKDEKIQNLRDNIKASKEDLKYILNTQIKPSINHLNKTIKLLEELIESEEK